MLTCPPAPRVDQDFMAQYYAEFRSIARRALRHGGRITIQPTELVHEAALRLLAGGSIDVRNEAHFLALAARVIRLTLIDEVRRRNAGKRSAHVVTLLDDHDAAVAYDLGTFDGLLDDLAKVAPEAAEVVQLRFYVGLTMAEIGVELGVSEQTALRRWRLARAWLLKELSVNA